MASYNTRAYGVMLHPRERKVLLRKEAEGWGLPHVDRPQYQFWACAEDITAAMQAQLGGLPQTLRCHVTCFDAQPYRVYYALENLDPAWALPPDCRWAAPEEITGTEGREAAESWFAWEAADDARRVPWFRRGWGREAREWIARQAAGGAIEHLRTCQRSVMLRVTVDGAVLYAKAVTRPFAQEVALTQYLDALFPGEVPRVVAADPARGWLLMEDAGAHSLRGQADLALWAGMLQRYAEMQVELARHVDRLAALGCPVRPPAHYLGALPDVLAHVEASGYGDVELRLTAEEIERLRGCAPVLDDACRVLMRSAVPLSLDHGDLWTGQILLRDGGFTFIDWSDAMLTHPFLSLFLYLFTEEIPTLFAEVPGAAETLRDAYLAPWQSFAPLENLHTLWHAARTLAPLHNAMLYDQCILPALEVRWEMENMVPYLLRRLLG